MGAIDVFVLAGQTIVRMRPWPQEALAVDRDHNRFASGGWNATARIWDRTTGHVLHTLKHGGDNINCVAFSSDGLRLATGGNDPEGFIQIWNVETGDRMSVIKAHRENTDDEVLSVSFSKDGNRLLSSSYDNTARLWDVKIQGKSFASLKATPGGSGPRHSLRMKTV